MNLPLVNRFYLGKSPYCDHSSCCHVKISHGISLRIGLVMSAASSASRGLQPRHVVKTMGCLSCEACLLYVRTLVDSILSAVVRKMSTRYVCH